MAQRVMVEVTDDFDGTPGASTVKFGLDGNDYEIDLSDEHAEQFRSFVQNYVNVGRKVAAGSGAKKRRAGGAGRGGDAAAMREWAQANGYEVNQRGRISADIKKAYAAAQGAPAPAPAPEEVAAPAEPAFSQ
jgi:hypothetical protein